MQQLSDPRIWRFAIALVIFTTVMVSPPGVTLFTIKAMLFLVLGVTAWDLWGQDLMPWARSLITDGDIAVPSIRREATNGGDSYGHSEPADGPDDSGSEKPKGSGTREAA